MKKYTFYKTGKSQPTKSRDDIDPEVESMTKNIQEKVQRNKLPSSTKLFCFRFLDEQMQKNEENPKVFCELFE